MVAIRKSTLKLTGGTAAAGKTRQIVYRVETDSPEDGPDVAEAYTGFSIGDPYVYGAESDSTIRVTNISIADVEKNRQSWDVTIDFARSEATSNPLTEPAKFSRSVQNREEAFERDTHGKPVHNSAGDRFDDVLTREVSRTILKVTKNFASWPQSNYQLVNTVNRTPYRVGDELYAERQIRLVNMSDEQAFSDELKGPSNPSGLYYAASLEFCFAEDDWDAVILDQGVRQSFARWDVTYVDANGRDELIGGVVVRVSHAIIERVNSAQEAQAIFIAGNPGAVIPTPARRIANGFEPCREKPAVNSEVKGTGRESQLPMALDGSGRQLFNGSPVWLEYRGYFEYEFRNFNLS
jgi:hypothetical protein